MPTGVPNPEQTSAAPMKSHHLLAKKCLRVNKNNFVQSISQPSCTLGKEQVPSDRLFL